MTITIPNDWKEESIINVTSYVDYRGKTPKKVEKGIFLITARNIKDGKIDYKLSTEYISEDDYDEVMKRGIPQKGDVLITTEAPLGSVAQIDNVNVALAQRIIKYRGNPGILDNGYLKYYLSSDYFQTQLLKKSTGSTVKGIKGTVLHKMKIILPPLKEQEKIAEILSTWDLAIDKQQQLIEKKKEFKKGLMQRLLIGEVRFKEFTDEWKTVKLGQIFKERKETGFNDLELLAITMANGVVRRTEVDVKDNSSEDKSKYKRILPGDIGYNTMRMWQGVSGLSKYEGIVSPAYTILKPVENIDSLYMSYLFKTPNVINLFYRYSQGLVSDTLNLKYENFKDIKVKIPSNIEEQKKIAEVLKTADKEIELLEKELEALKLQKKGLMQRLLTGEVRVKVD